MKIKIITGLALIVFFVFMTTLFTAGIVATYKQRDSQEETVKRQEANNKLASAQTIDDPSLVGALTEEEIAKHNTSADCWLVIEGNVYNVTPFISQHPGGGESITSYCGQEATEAFNSRGRKPAEKHSSFAANLLRSYYVGPFGRLPEEILFPGQSDPSLTALKPLVFATPAPINFASNNAGSGTSSSLVIDSTEVGRHSTLQNCWMIISGKVYDITGFVASHPGGQPALAPYCGKEATSAFQSKGGGGSNHSSYAYSLLGNFLIGNLGSSIVVNNNGNVAINNPGSGTSTNTAPTPTNYIAPTNPPASGSSGGTTPPAQSNLTLSTSEIATHNTRQNCWLIISGNVYDVTGFISNHPGGASVITNRCGADATSAFQNQGHSSYAYSLLSQYLIGSVGSSVPVNATPTPGGGGSTTTNPTVPPSGGGSSSDLPQAILDRYPGATRRSGGYEDNGSWEGKIDSSNGCREMKVNSSGAITKDESC